MKKIKRYAGVLALLAVATLVLSACGATTDPHVAPHSGIYGWVYQWLGRPLQNIMIQTAHMIGGDNGAGWGIVIITVVVRVILMPLMLVQQNKSVRQQEKMARLQPQMKLIQNAMRHKGITPDQQMTLSTWQRELYSKNQVSLTGGMGCLPLIIQLPIMWGIYQAVFSFPFDVISDPLLFNAFLFRNESPIYSSGILFLGCPFYLKTRISKKCHSDMCSFLVSSFSINVFCYILAK